MFPIWSYIAVASAVASGSAVLLMWSLFADRSRGRNRCPKCWYSMDESSGTRCPECGHKPKRVQHLHRTRRRWHGVWGSTIGFALAGFVAVQPKVQYFGWGSVTPPTLLILALQFGEEDWIIDGIGYHMTYDLIHRPRVRRIGALQRELPDFELPEPDRSRALWKWQWRWLGYTVLDRIEKEPQSTSLRATYQKWLSWSREFAGDVELRHQVNEAFRREMGHSDPAIRGYAARFSADYADIRGSIDRLFPLLDSEDEQTRAGAVLGLRLIAMKSQDGMNALISATSHVRADVRLTAVASLGDVVARIGWSNDAYDALLRSADDPDCDVRHHQVRSIVRMQDHDTKWLTIRAALNSEDICTRRGGIYAMLFHWPPPASLAAAMIHCLTDDDDDIRKYARWVLGNPDRQLSGVISAKELEMIEALVHHEDREVRQTAISLLDRVHGPFR